MLNSSDSSVDSNSTGNPLLTFNRSGRPLCCGTLTLSFRECPLLHYTVLDAVLVADVRVATIQLN